MSGTTITTYTRTAGASEQAGQLAVHLAVALEASRPGQAGRIVPLPEQGEIVLSRGSSTLPAVAAFGDGRMSAPHAKLVRTDQGWSITDLGSKNGTRVNNERVTSEMLRDGDLIEAGSTFLIFRATAESLDGPVANAVPAFRTLVPSLRARFDELARVAPSNESILIRGATGTGKELTARAIHQLSGRAGRFVGVNCGALTESLLGAELFGVRKGAYSGAEEERIGLVRSAEGGTLFLDEIAELSESSQVALLRVLEESEVKPVGGSAAIEIDVRFVAATHQDLEQRIVDGRFRQDLYARLSGFVVELPPLIERLEDMGILVSEILSDSAPDGTPGPSLSRTAARALMLYDWPMNIRELQNALRAARLLAHGAEISLRHLPATIRRYLASGAERPVNADDLSLHKPDALRRELERLYRQHRGNISAVARELGKARAQVQRWNRKLGIDPAAFDS